ncbi:hypothetical protein LINPERPRIM_LOCUS32506, partial [Linum perenne]
ATTLTLLLLASLTTYAFWSSDPTLTIVRLRLTKVKIRTFPILNIDIKMNVTVEVQNADVYAAELRKTDVEAMYRGETIGVVRSMKGSVIRAYTTSYLEAEMNLNRIGVIANELLLIRDLKTVEAPFGMVVEVAGKFGFLCFRFPLKARISCEVMLKTREGKVEGGGRCGRRRIGLGFEIGWVSIRIGCMGLVWG